MNYEENDESMKHCWRNSPSQSEIKDYEGNVENMKNYWSNSANSQETRGVMTVK